MPIVNPEAAQAVSVSGQNMLRLTRTAEGNIEAGSLVKNPEDGKFNVRGGVGIYDPRVLKATLDLLLTDEEKEAA